MSLDLLLYAIGVWIILVFLAVLNGISRGLYTPRVGKQWAHVISTITAIIMFLAVVYLFLRYGGVDHSQTDLIILGIYWTILTVVFEFLFGHYVVKHPWEMLLVDYDLRKGRVWSLFLLTMLIGPYMMGLLI